MISISREPVTARWQRSGPRGPSRDRTSDRIPRAAHRYRGRGGIHSRTRRSRGPGAFTAARRHDSIYVLVSFVTNNRSFDTLKRRESALPRQAGCGSYANAQIFASVAIRFGRATALPKGVGPKRTNTTQSDSTVDSLHDRRAL